MNIEMSITNKDKAKLGIYFTPNSLINYMLGKINELDHHIENVLEPSCGMCDFIKNDAFPQNVYIDCVEFHKKIYETIKNDENLSYINFHNADFLQWETEFKYDLILGNPPYYTIKKNIVNERYNRLYNGRPNIYIIFIIRAIELLANNGILAFVLPQNFLCCEYYNKLRRRIYKKYEIIDICEFTEEFADTKQPTCAMIIRNSRNNTMNEKFCCNNIFGSPKRIRLLRKLYKNSTRLNELKVDISVGNIVWNQAKKKLTNDESKTLLIYNSDITNTFELANFSNPEKKHYINMEGISEKVVVVNRGYGRGKYKFNYSLINIEKPVLFENHLLVIRALDETLEKIMASFNDRRTHLFVKHYFVNGAMNVNELKYKLPIYHED